MHSPRQIASLEALASHVGEELGVSDWMSVTQEMIDRFADVTHDRQWIHIDPERCRRELGSGTLAHGYLVLSLLAPFSYAAYSVSGVSHAINYGSDKVRYLAPVPAGARLRGRFRLLEVERQEGRLKAKTEASVEMEGHHKPVLVAQTLVLFYEEPT